MPTWIHVNGDLVELNTAEGQGVADQRAARRADGPTSSGSLRVEPEKVFYSNPG